MVYLQSSAAHMHASVQPLLQHPSTGHSTIVLAPAATLTEGPEQETLVCACRCYIIYVRVSSYTPLPLTREKYKKMPSHHLPSDLGKSMVTSNFCMGKQNFMGLLR